MKKPLNYVLNIMLFISFVCVMACTGFIFFCELFGYDKGNTFLEFINFPLNDDGVILVGYICAAVLIISIFIREKLKGKVKK